MTGNWWMSSWSRSSERPIRLGLTEASKRKVDRQKVIFLVRYEAMEHRCGPHSRMEGWLGNFAESGARAVCSWERFCTFAREAERRKVGGNCRWLG